MHLSLIRVWDWMVPFNLLCLFLETSLDLPINPNFYTYSVSFLFKLIFNWSITVSQCYFSSAVQKYESAINTHPLILEPPSHPTSTPLGCHRAPGWAPGYTATSHPPFILHMVMYICQSYSLNFPTRSCVYRSIHCICNSIPALEIGSSVPCF